MGAIYALIAEITPNFVDPFKPAHDQTLEVEFNRDTQVEIAVKRIMMRDKWACGCASIERLQDGRLDFDEAVFVQVTAHGADSAAANHEDVARLVSIGDQVQVALALASLHIFQSVILLRQGTQPLCEYVKLLSV